MHLPHLFPLCLPPITEGHKHDADDNVNPEHAVRGRQVRDGRVTEVSFVTLNVIRLFVC